MKKKKTQKNERQLKRDPQSNNQPKPLQKRFAELAVLYLVNI